MKNNLISAIAGWKSTALLALIAMVAAVAFSGVFTNTAQAATVDLDGNETSVTAAPGDTVNIIFEGTEVGFVQASIDPSSSSSGSFGTGGAQSVACSADTPCDVGRTDADPPAADTTNVTVALNIDADSAEGFILVKLGQVGGTAGADTKVITVSKVRQAGSISVSAAAKVIAVNQTVGGDAASITTLVTARLLNAQEPPAGLNIVSPGGVKFDVDGPATLTCGGTASGQVCTVPTADFDHDDDQATAEQMGYAQATVTSTGRPGNVTVTASFPGGLEDTVEIIVYGAATNITAVANESAIEIGGKTLIVVTSTDGAGNPVSRQTYDKKAKDGVVGPSEEAEHCRHQRQRQGHQGRRPVSASCTRSRCDLPGCCIVPTRM